MKRTFASLLVLCCLFGSFSVFASADAQEEQTLNQLLELKAGLADSASSNEQKATYNWESYTLDELLEIQNEMSAVIAEKQRQYAIEHGDRKILLPEEQLVYVGGSVNLVPTVEKVLETAPDSTSFIWTSSDDSVATISSSGTLRGVAKGEAVVTCTAADSEFIFAEVAVESVLPVSGVKINEEIAEILIFEGKDNILQLTNSIEPQEAYCQDVVWSSNAEEIATVDENGCVSLLTPGRVTISATSLDEFSANSPKKGQLSLNILQAASSLELDQSSLVINRGSSASLKPTILPENASNKSVVWESSAPEIVTVSSGQIRGVECGTATITCMAADGSGVYSTCVVEVIQMVTGVKFIDARYPVTLEMNSSMQLKTEISPDYATNQEVKWTSSDEGIVSVSETGEITANSGGTATITCAALDGSEKTAVIDVFVPSIAIETEEYIVVDKEGMSFEAKYYGAPGNFEISASSTSYFTVKHSEDEGTITVDINPIKAGEAYITLKDKSDSKNNRTIYITIDHSAVYDKISYPQANYSDILRNPNQNDGKTYSIYGKVLQVMDGGFYGIARVGTGGYGYYDNVFYVTFYPFMLDTNIIEDDMVTIYGECTGTHSYEAISGATITIPALTADKIILGVG